MNGVQTRFKCKLDVKRCKRFVFPPSSLLPRSNALKTKAIRYFQTDRTLTRIVSPPLQRGFKPAPDVDAIMALTSSQMDAINTALAQQIEQNRQLKAQLANQPTEVVTEQVTVNQIAPAPQSVFFQIGSAVLPTNSTVNLQQIADLVKDNPGLKLKVTGYADSDTGSAAWNKQLSEDRANNVANELVKLGVNKNNLIISGMGGVNTLTPPAFNRRVIIEAQ